MVRYGLSALGLWMIAAFSAAPALAGDLPVFEIVIENHKFVPEEVVIPAKSKVKLIVINKDKTPEEFESHDFNREKIIPGGNKATIFVGPLKPGTYTFFGEFNPDTAQGRLIVK